MLAAILRTIAVFCVITVSMRLMGKRQLGELEPSELVVAVLVSNAATIPLEDLSMPLLTGLVPVLTLVGCEMLVSSMILRSVKLRALLCGKPAMLIRDGVIDQAAMHRSRMTLDELAEELRKQGLTEHTQVSAAVLETDGTVSVIPKSEFAPLTPSGAGVTPPKDEYPLIFINEGRVLSRNLSLAGRTEKWLHTRLRREGLTSPRQVYLMTGTAGGQVCIVPKEQKSAK